MSEESLQQWVQEKPKYASQNTSSTLAIAKQLHQFTKIRCNRKHPRILI